MSPRRLLPPLLLAAAATASAHRAGPSIRFRPLIPRGGSSGPGGGFGGLPDDPLPSMGGPPPPASASGYGGGDGGLDSVPLPGDHVPYEERLSAWRRQQQEQYDRASDEQLNSVVDDQGRTKLLTSMSKTSVPIMFFILLTRSIHHFELADAGFKGATRLFFVLPTVLLFVGNLSGVVVGALASVKGTGSTKRRLKAILNLNKLVEVLCMVYNVIRMAAVPSEYVPREMYVARTVTNFMFLSFCQVYTKVTWGGVSAKDPMLQTEGPYGGTGEDYHGGQPSSPYAGQGQPQGDYGYVDRDESW